VSFPQIAAEKAQSVSPLSWIGFRMPAVSTRGKAGEGKLGSSVDEESKEADDKMLSELSLEFGDEAMDGGEAYDTTKDAICSAILILLVGYSEETEDVADESFLHRFLSTSQWPLVVRAFSQYATRSLRRRFSFRSCSFSSLSFFAMFCNATLRSISPCS
jgi:hypothetical protein